MAKTIKNKIIDYGELTDAIENIETILEIYDNEEKALIIKNITERFNRTNQERKSKEISMGILKKMPGGSIFFGGDKK